MKALATALLLFGLGSLQAATVSELLARGDEADERNKNRAALEAYLEADRQQPDNAEILRRVAKQYAQLMLETRSKSEQRKLGAQAIDAAERAVASDPNNALARISLAIVLGRAAFLESPGKQVEMSKRIGEEAARATRLDPSEPLGWHVLGRWNYELANFNPFLKSLAQTIYGKFPNASNERAAEYLGKAVELEPRNSVFRIEYGRALAAMGRKAEARRQIERGLSLPTRDKDAEETARRGRETLRKL